MFGLAVLLIHVHNKRQQKHFHFREVNIWQDCITKVKTLKYEVKW